MVSKTASTRFQEADWLAEMDEKSRLALLEALEEKRAEKGAILLKVGDENVSVTFLLEGSVAITRHYPGHGEELVTRLEAPALFGVTSFFGPNPPIVTARAETPVLVLTLSRDAYDRLRAEQPCVSEQFSRAVLLVLAGQFDMLDHKVSEFLAQHGLPHRVDEWNEFRSKLFTDSTF